MSDNKYQYHHNRTDNHIVRAHAHSQTVEYSRKDTSRQTEGKQTNILKHVAQQTRSHVVRIPQTQSDIHKHVLTGTVEEKYHNGSHTKNA